MGSGASSPGGVISRGIDQRAFDTLNEGLATTYRHAGVTVADVARTFQIDNFAETVVVQGRGRLPVNVALTCRWTWFCSERHLGDPHPNRIGYARIAHTFYRELRAVLP